MRCPGCATSVDKVIDSRAAEEGGAIRRRRECLECGRRFTTYERIEETPLLVVKRNGMRQQFDRSKMMLGMSAATKNLPISVEQLESAAAEIEEAVRLGGAEVRSLEIGVAVLERLRLIDGVAYLRFASVYKGFTDPDDFAREVRLLAKATLPKPPTESAP